MKSTRNEFGIRVISFVHLNTLVIMKSTTRRDGRPIDEVGYYNPITKQSHFDLLKIEKWLNYGVQPTETVSQLLKKANIT